MRRTWVFVVVPLALALVGLMNAADDVKTELSIKGSRFAVNGKQTFLVGLSYYGGLGTPREFVTRDLDDMQKLGVNWVRVWATWGAFENDVKAVDSNGLAREPYLSNLNWLVAECDRRAMVVDVTLSRGNGVVGSPRLQSLQSHRRAVETIVAALKEYRNWYLDLGNERNIKDDRFVSFDDLRQLRDAVRQIDAARLVTASHAGDIPEQELRKYVLDVGVDFISPHRPRSAESPKQTADKTRQYLARLKELGRLVPVHYQEPFRRGFTEGWEPAAADFVADALGAIEGGAAGWCLHNGAQRDRPDSRPRRSFDMRRQRLFDQLDEEEKRAVDKLSELSLHF